MSSRYTRSPHAMRQITHSARCSVAEMLFVVSQLAIKRARVKVFACVHSSQERSSGVTCALVACPASAYRYIIIRPPHHCTHHRGTLTTRHLRAHPHHCACSCRAGWRAASRMPFSFRPFGLPAGLKAVELISMVVKDRSDTLPLGARQHMCPCQ